MLRLSLSLILHRYQLFLVEKSKLINYFLCMEAFFACISRCNYVVTLQQMRSFSLEINRNFIMEDLGNISLYFFFFVLLVFLILSFLSFLFSCLFSVSVSCLPYIGGLPCLLSKRYPEYFHVRLGKVSKGQVLFNTVVLGYVMFCGARLNLVRLGWVRQRQFGLGQDRMGQVRIEWVRLGQVRFG